MIGAGVGGTYSQDGVDQVDRWLALHPSMQNWVIAHGTNDSANGDPALAAGYRERMQTTVDRLHAAGRTMWVPRIPYNLYGAEYLPAYNAVVDELVATRGVRRGPDLYAHFLADPEQLGDGVHPTAFGSAQIHRLWAETVAPYYPR